MRNLTAVAELERRFPGAVTVFVENSADDFTPAFRRGPLRHDTRRTRPSAPPAMHRIKYGNEPATSGVAGGGGDRSVLAQRDLCVPARGSRPS